MRCSILVRWYSPLGELLGSAVQGIKVGSGWGVAGKYTSGGPLLRFVARLTKTHSLRTYLWLVGNGRMVVMVLIIVPIPPFPTNQRQEQWFWVGRRGFPRAVRQLGSASGKREGLKRRDERRGCGKLWASWAKLKEHLTLPRTKP